MRTRGDMRKALSLVAAVMTAATLTLVAVAGPAGADSEVTGFEDFSTGSPNAQFGWSALGTIGSGCALYDHAIVNNIYGIASFGAKTLRMSNAVTSGCFSDQTFSAGLTNEAGETDAINGGKSGGARQPYFQASWDFASADPTAEQVGLSVVASPDRGDGARMSWVQMTDTSGGIDVNFYEYVDAAPFGGSGTETDGYGPEDDFVLTPVATGLDRTIVHHISITMELVDGQHNDVVTVCVDGTTCHTGTSWEDYYRFYQGPPAGPEWNGIDGTGSRTIDSLLFRTGGAAAPANAGKGFLIDNLHTTTSAVPTSSTVVVDPPNMNGWAFFNEGLSGSGALVSGPGGALNDGSAQLVVDATGRHNIGTLAFAGTRLDEISELSYSSYRASADPGNLFAISLQFEFDDDLTDANDTFRGRLVFEPYLTVGSGNVAEDTWYTWDTLEGKWWSSNATFALTCSQASPCTTQKVLATWPNAGIRKPVSATAGLLNFRAGGPWAPGFDGNVDDFRIAISGAETIFDFEPETPCSTVCYVDTTTGNDANGGSTPGTAKKTIQAAVAQVSPGGTIYVAAGTYTEVGQIVIGKDLTIIGAGAGSTIIKPSADTGSSGDARGWFLVNDGFTFNLSDVTLDGTGRQVYQAIRNKGQGTISDCAFSNIKFGTYYGVGMVVFGSPAMNVDVTNCTFSGIGRVGVLFFGSGVTDSTFSDNTYTGKGDGDWLDYAVEVGGGATATITGNTISGNTGVATVDGSTSAGILVTTFYGTGTTADITKNVISDSTTGVAIGYDASDTSVATVNRNSITDNVDGVANTGSGTVNAECNWWGGITGAVAPNNATTGNVDAAPWLTTSDLDGDCFGGTWTFEGFFSPVNNPDDPESVNAAKAGQTVPFKYRITDEGGVPIDDESSFVSLTSYKVSCNTLADEGLDAIENYSSGLGLQSKGDGNWQFNWTTPTGYRNTCRAAVLTLGDGSQHEAYFQFRK